MFKAIKLALKYRDLLEPAIEFINVVQNSVKDGHLTKKRTWGSYVTNVGYH